MQDILEQLKQNMQTVYRKSVDADSILNKLHASGKGKFSEVFPVDAGFKVQSKRFGPYVEELAKEISQLAQKDEGAFKAALPNIVRKMELLLSTLLQFRQALKD